MNIVCIMQARTGSTRLPGKVLRKICGKTVLEHDINRLKKSNTINIIVVATTTLDQDDIIVEIAREASVTCFRGSQDDVLSRYYYAAKENKADVVIRVTSDCPLIDPQIIDSMVRKFIELRNKENIDYLSNKIKMTYPRGLDVEIFTFEALERCFNEGCKPYEREHVTPYIYLNPDKFSFVNYENNNDYSRYRWTLDTEEDLKLIEIIYNNLYNEKSFFYFEDILKFVLDNPEISKINEDVRQKELGE
ncbi:acylneuraminate cytidylyltransferase [Clostridium carboxidivorans P7]|uniref:Acylneuraminate cytidylyltransferase n=1 Tax=Clostridium carboxidivorans P7 TaxID=536227 RepID=C6PPI2_9CLOT|nr:glycosyltransferase family protein [Clostridium carboxidivorans]AKN33923.1 acylneuraminate cytidylyltransferase [Clostridium carboxidivorans P7]EET88876.1 acylneuraminate cytidylyltransferase [Clostridium carboxidivorans P7]EFG88206.1 cytidylyltransferase [Clostridium carboxidivorans P7]